MAINYKFDALALSTAIYDIERGQLSAIRPRYWQNDTAIAKNSWGYTNNNEFKDPRDIICDLIDIVSKNGALLLNVGPKADGTICEEDQKVLRSIGKWLSINGEGIYNTTFWHKFGEGPTKIPEGSFTDIDRDPFTSKDIRFTYKAPYLYAFIMKKPENGEIFIEALALPDLKVTNGFGKCFMGHIEGVSLLGFDNRVCFERGQNACLFKIEGAVESKDPICLKIKID